MSAKIQLNIWHVAKYPGWDWALLGLLEARPGVRSVAKPILMLDLDGRGTRDNTESDFRRKVHREGVIGVNDTNIICTLM